MVFPLFHYDSLFIAAAMMKNKRAVNCCSCDSIWNLHKFPYFTTKHKINLCVEYWCMVYKKRLLWSMHFKLQCSIKFYDISVRWGVLGPFFLYSLSLSHWECMKENKIFISHFTFQVKFALMDLVTKPEIILRLNESKIQYNWNLQLSADVSIEGKKRITQFVIKIKLISKVLHTAHHFKMLFICASIYRIRWTSRGDMHNMWYVGTDGLYRYKFVFFFNFEKSGNRLLFINKNQNIHLHFRIRNCLFADRCICCSVPVSKLVQSIAFCVYVLFLWSVVAFSFVAFSKIDGNFMQAIQNLQKK